VKFGGNAQAITKQRFLHHTSLLWDYHDSRMKLLKHPAKIPDYRAVRMESALPCMRAFMAS
jgi:lipoate-protein ligase A